MIDNLKVLALIPARGGSKSLPRKNLYPLGGKPLLAWPIDTALQTPEIDKIIVSTDDNEIANVALSLGVDIHRRPKELAGDKSLVIDTIRHVKKQLEDNNKIYEIAVLLEATSPFRTPEMISNCLRRLVNENFESIATFSESELPPERMWNIVEGKPKPFIKGAIPWLPRQSLTKVYKLNASVYAFRLDRLPKSGLSLLFGNFGAEKIHDKNVIDIDNEKDFLIAKSMLGITNET